MTPKVRTPTKTFTSAKLDILDAISMDPRVTNGEFRIAYRLAQHANSKTGAIFPSQDRLASQTGMTIRGVRNCIAGLIKKGWLRARRPNRRLSNFYEFDGRHVNPILDRQIMLDDVRREERAAKAIPHDRHSRDGQKRLTGMTMPLVTGIQMPPNTSSKHLKEISSEERDSLLNAGGSTSDKRRSGQ